MKTILRKIALALTSLLALIGINKARAADTQKVKAPREARQRVIVLDEYEQSAFHGN
jgi:hypothetical protein